MRFAFFGTVGNLDFNYGEMRRLDRTLGSLGAAHEDTPGVRRAWAATIDYTPDHLPIIGPLLGGVDWRARALFLGPTVLPNAAPTAAPRRATPMMHSVGPPTGSRASTPTR